MIASRSWCVGASLAAPVIGGYVRNWLGTEVPGSRIYVCSTPNRRHSGLGWECLKLTHSGSRGSPIRDMLYRRFQPFRHLHDCCGLKPEVQPRSRVRLLLGEEQKSVRQFVECFALDRERESTAVESRAGGGAFARIDFGGWGAPIRSSR